MQRYSTHFTLVRDQFREHFQGYMTAEFARGLRCFLPVLHYPFASDRDAKARVQALATLLIKRTTWQFFHLTAAADGATSAALADLT